MGSEGSLYWFGLLGGAPPILYVERDNVKQVRRKVARPGRVVLNKGRFIGFSSDEETHMSLHRLASANGRTVSAEIRLAIRKHLAVAKERGELEEHHETKSM